MALEFNKLAVQFGQNSGLIKELYEQFLVDETLVPEEWAIFFRANTSTNGSSYTPVNGNHSSSNVAPLLAQYSDSKVASAAGALVQEYRQKGHLAAKINPLTMGIMAIPRPVELSYSYQGLQTKDLAENVPSFGFSADEHVSLKELIEKLERCYCASIGFQYTHLSRPGERLWLEEKIERRKMVFSQERQQHILSKLVQAEGFENNLHRKYIGKKWFSLQGAETIIPAIDALIERAAVGGTEAIYFGMAHRGRLNMLVNILGKSLSQVFAEFEEDSVATAVGAGDVKYHLGRTHFHHGESGKTVRLELAPNPSHLEFVNPVVEGMVRASQDHSYRADRKAVLPLLFHGDSAFIGQGVVYETLNLANLSGFTTGGTIHIVINNQVGFTTTPDEYRSSAYCTDMALGLDVPILHVNAEDIEACIWATELAVDFRQQFGRDVILDIYCYRKYGHNESDDPSFTQPLMYKEISQKKPLTQIYASQLVEGNVIEADQLQRLHDEYRIAFEDADDNRRVSLIGEACSTLGRLRVHSPKTVVTTEALREIAEALVAYPEGFTPHPKLRKIIEKRVDTVRNDDQSIEWGIAEALAYGSLLTEGVQVRLTGQDVCRGTFSHRHLVLDDYEKAGSFNSLQLLSDRYQHARFDIFNSSLSEAGVVGFEFGYSTIANKSLVIWEAQFGDFGNGAQVFLDQFISSSEAKWEMLSGLTLFLPHAYEGMGPEHSSARLERYLQLCGEGNMMVCYPSNAAQQFHLIRRQGLMDGKRPLIVMTPKSLLRLPAAACSLADLSTGAFETAIETTLPDTGSSPHVILLTGKVYYEVIELLKSAGAKNVKVIRVEQLYPFPQFEIKKLLKDCTPQSVVWLQEEPQNMGAWSYIEPYLRAKLNADVLYVGRPVSASTASGSNKRHTKEQQQLLQELLSHVQSGS